MQEFWYEPGNASGVMSLDFVDVDLFDYEIGWHAEWGGSGVPKLTSIQLPNGHSFDSAEASHLSSPLLKAMVAAVWSAADARLADALEDQLREARRVAA